jgi:chemotaxis protein methyltransferase CheR
MLGNLEIESKEIKELISVVKVKYNFDFSNYATCSLKRRLERVLELNNFQNSEELIGRISESESFFNRFLKDITVNTTEMFRDPSMWRKIKTDVLPILSQNPMLKIWHAACSSGEEVYSMAILLKEEGLLDRSTIYASDINEDVLDVAKKGTYPFRNMELNEANYNRFGGKTSLSSYYTKKDDKAAFDSSLTSKVKFKTHDLVLGSAFSKFDLILCRNVFIYFNFQLQENVVRMFHESLFRNGHLIVGSKETISWCKTAEKFSTVCSDERIYKKEKE